LRQPFRTAAIMFTGLPRDAARKLMRGLRNFNFWISAAWRFAGEMAEIAATFREAGLPGEFHAAAEMIYRRLAGFKGASSTPSLEEVLKTLIPTAYACNI
jgi:hypothetical protein